MSSTHDLLFRTNDALRWGDGLGRNLHPAEVDLNFWILLELFMSLASNPAQPKNISSITVTNNQMTIHLDDGVTNFGPFTLPIATFTWRGNWTPDTEYHTFDLFNESNGLFLVNQDHTSNAVFDSADGNIAGHYYKILLAYPVLFDIGFFFPGLPGTGIAAGRPIFSYLAAHDFFLKAGLPETVAATDEVFTVDTSFPIQKNDDVIGSVNFVAGESVPTYVFPDDIQFVGGVGGDKLKVMTPASVDMTGRDLNLTFAATKGELEPPSSS